MSILGTMVSANKILLKSLADVQYNDAAEYCARSRRLVIWDGT